MPRVVPDQKNKFETDELFKKLSQDVRYTAYKEKPVEERKRKFIEDLQEGHSVITFLATGTNLSLQFCLHGLSDDCPDDPSVRPTREQVDFEREPNRVHMQCGFIMNGVCVKWNGWIDLETLNGKARLAFDDDQAKIEEEVMKRVMKETQERVRMFEENQRRWQEMQSPPMQQT